VIFDARERDGWHLSAHKTSLTALPHRKNPVNDQRFYYDSKLSAPAFRKLLGPRMRTVNKLHTLDGNF
jgi:hypothetical protein